MKKETKHSILRGVFAGYTLLNSLALSAQSLPPTGGGTTGANLGLKSASDSLWSEVRGSAPTIFAIIFLVSILMNIGKVSGSERDYKGFFAGIALWLGGLIMVSGVVTYIVSMSF